MAKEILSVSEQELPIVINILKIGCYKRINDVHMSADHPEFNIIAKLLEWCKDKEQYLISLT